MNRKEIIQLMKSQSTWRLYLLSALSLGIYTAFYVQQQSQKLLQIPNMPPISPLLIQGLFGCYMLSAFVTVASFFVPPEHAFNVASSLFSIATSLLAIVWAFQMRSRFNLIFASPAPSADWFHGGWTFLFTVFYINYKFNTLHQDLEEVGYAS